MGCAPRWLSHGASSGRPAPARSVWSACVFSAALQPTFSQRAVQGFKARTPSGNSLHEPHSQSGAKDARTPNAAASFGRPPPARSVWSACVFSAALGMRFMERLHVHLVAHRDHEPGTPKLCRVRDKVWEMIPARFMERLDGFCPRIATMNPQSSGAPVSRPGALVLVESRRVRRPALQFMGRIPRNIRALNP